MTFQIEVNKFRHCVAVFRSSKVLEKFPVSWKVHVRRDISSEVTPNVNMTYTGHSAANPRALFPRELHPWTWECLLAV